ncbi:ATP-binding protein [Pseudomonas sp. S191]|uniref:ATP-binding protein n=1 Tax=Pseudomonas sp. S191 TaxID=579575 RepID=UPI00387B2C48
MKALIKPTQLTRVGYSYQDLVCIKILLDWFHDPSKYQWVSIESTGTDEGMLNGLDDVVAFDGGGRYELYQVKFTIDSERADLALGFDWLLKKKPNGTSLLKKWSSDVDKYRALGMLSKAALVTNRVPDSVFARCLRGDKVDVDLIPDEFLTRLQNELDGRIGVECFFRDFTFQHSQPQIDDLETKLYDSVVPDHTTNEGWFRFLKAIERQATRKPNLESGAKITLEYLRDLFEQGISKTLSQYLSVPDGYSPPSEEFHLSMMEKCASQGCWVVSGKPGTGKSTYLSYLNDVLIESGVPVIRHHYHLSAQSDIDRIAFQNAARSLEAQLKDYLPSTFSGRELKAEELDQWILLAANEFLRQGKTLVIVIDGLDHVSRERSEITQLEHMINRIIPFKGTTCLIFGTQAVSDSQLPSKMVSEVSRSEDWLELPFMSLKSIRSWVEGLVKSKSISINCARDGESRELVEIAEALHKVSSGYALYLVYSIRRLQQKNKVVSAYEIEQLPIFSGGDITKYYDLLWSNLSVSAREILQLIASVEFAWPDRNALSLCFDNNMQFVESFDRIQHLFHFGRSGITPFHSSIIVYVKGRDGFEVSANGLLKKVNAWLEGSAPSYWRWAWYWVVRARLGDTRPLLEGVTREWMIASFCLGYPLSHIEKIISLAEFFAMSEGLFPELVKLRLIKIRLVNGPGYQLQRYDLFYRCAQKWSDESYSLHWKADNLRILGDAEISAVAILFRGKDESVVYNCFEELVRRVHFYHQCGDDSHFQKIEALIYFALDTLINSVAPDLQKIFWIAGWFDERDAVYQYIFKGLVAAGNGDLILDIPVENIPDGFVSMYWGFFVLACCDAGVSFLARPEAANVGKSSFVAILTCLENQPCPEELLDRREFTFIDKPDDGLFYEAFFYFFARQLMDAETRLAVEMPTLSESFGNRALAFFKYAGCVIADEVKRKNAISIFHIYDLILSINPPERTKCSFDEQGIWHSVSRALTDVSIDTARLLEGSGLIGGLTQGDYEKVKPNVMWVAKNWLGKCIEKNAAHILSSDLAKQMVVPIISALKLEKNDTSVLANDSLELVSIASSLGLEHEVRLGLKLAAKNTLGYGYRKDTSFSELYEAIEIYAQSTEGDVSNWLRRIAPFTSDMFDFTEREIGHIPRLFIDLLARYSPERLVDEFEYSVSQQNWRLARDILEKYVEHYRLDDPAAKALVLSQTTYQVFKALENRSESEPDVKLLFDELSEGLGGTPMPPRERSSGSNFVEKPVNIEPAKYPPKDIRLLHAKFIDDGVYSAHEFMCAWMSYWVELGKGLDVIKAFETFYMDGEEIPFRMAPYLDDVFDLSLKLCGAKRSYCWAVRSVKANSHWGRYTGSSSDQIIKRYGALYAGSWKTFLKDTLGGIAFSSRGDEWVIVPTVKLVIFFLAVKQPVLAQQVVEVMLEILEDEISHLPIEDLHWRDTPVLSSEISRELLLCYWWWPDRMARVRAANQIALIIEQEAAFGSVYLEHLNGLTSEIDVADFLSILLLVKRQVFMLEEIVASIRYPSILSDLILVRLGYFPIRGVRRYFTLFEECDFKEGNDFKRACNGVPSRYAHVLSGLEDEFNTRLLDRFSAEWRVISEREQVYVFDPYAFCNEYFYGQDNIGCSFSSRSEGLVISAYLRVLAYVDENFEMSADKLQWLVNEAASIGGEYTHLLPSIKPDGWPSIEVIKSDDPLPTEGDLIGYLRGFLSKQEFVIRSNGPVIRDLAGVSCDLETRLIYCGWDIEESAETVYSMVSRRSSMGGGIKEMAGVYFPEDFGRWETDLLMRGYFVPNFTLGSFESSVEVTKSAVEFFSGDSPFANWKYWCEEWYPVFYRGLGPQLGTYIGIPNEVFESFKPSGTGGFYLLGKLTMIDRRGYKPKDPPVEVFAMLPIP